MLLFMLQTSVTETTTVAGTFVCISLWLVEWCDAIYCFMEKLIINILSYALYVWYIKECKKKVKRAEQTNWNQFDWQRNYLTS